MKRNFQYKEPTPLSDLSYWRLQKRMMGNQRLPQKKNGVNTFVSPWCWRASTTRKCLVHFRGHIPYSPWGIKPALTSKGLAHLWVPVPFYNTCFMLIFQEFKNCNCGSASYLHSRWCLCPSYPDLFLFMGF